MNFISKSFDDLSLNQLYEILRSRCEIFTLEQSIHYQDMDGIDRKAIHFFLEDEGRIVAYLRAFYEDKDIVRIGRVLSLTHGIGLGKKLMELSLDEIKKSMPCKTISLDSQSHAVDFYKRFGFNAVSDEFIEAGIPHIRMELKV